MNTLENLLPILIGIPFCVGAISLLNAFFKHSSNRVLVTLHVVSIVSIAVISSLLAVDVFMSGTLLTSGEWFILDPLSSLFLVVLALVTVITGVYSIGYIGHEFTHGELSVTQFSLYYGLFNVFVATMIVALTTNNIVLMWVAIEATTVSSTFLVGIYFQRSSLEAAWKYIMLCSIGIALGLFGTVLTYANGVAVFDSATKALLWTDIRDNAALLDPQLIQIGFVFIMIGFGTKMGLFPMHTWLPDAHSEAPSPVSALLSAGLLNCAFLVILRHYVIGTEVLGSDFTNAFFIGFGLLSIGFSAFLILVQSDVKRLLAYSSVENMGLIALAVGLGPLGVFAAMLHVINHSLGKTLMFCGAGNIMLKYGTRDMNAIKGIVKVAPWTGVLFGCGALALAGMPPFNLFISEFLVICSGIYSQHPVLTIVVLLLLTIVLAGFARLVSKCVFGTSPKAMERGEFGISTVAPLVVVIAMMLVMGTNIPAFVVDGADMAAQVVLNETEHSVLDSLDLPWGTFTNNSDAVTLMSQE
ncbi:hydrogenase 4 subunit F [Vibrio variabilis]|uniref:hydrogenase 4 subunit F n=1 Tax=Vibrio variabilis TaxID=990271 RepID=UPI000DD811D8|nr:hydrogenase 4 subunit F [Vibrio variabilis]